METRQSSGGEIQGGPQETTFLKNTMKNVCDKCAEVSLMLWDGGYYKHESY